MKQLGRWRFSCHSNPKHRWTKSAPKHSSPLFLCRSFPQTDKFSKCKREKIETQMQQEPFIIACFCVFRLLQHDPKPQGVKMEAELLKIANQCFRNDRGNIVWAPYISFFRHGCVVELRSAGGVCESTRSSQFVSICHFHSLAFQTGWLIISVKIFKSEFQNILILFFEAVQVTHFNYVTLWDGGVEQIRPLWSW